MELAQSWAIKAYPVGAKREVLSELVKSTRVVQTGALRKIAYFIDENKKSELIANVSEELLSRNNELMNENLIKQIVTKTLDKLKGVDIEETMEEIHDLSKTFLRKASKPRYLLISFSKGLTSHAIATAFWEDKFLVVNCGVYAKNLGLMGCISIH